MRHLLFYSVSLMLFGSMTYAMNQNVQSWIDSCLEVRQSPLRGMGLFTTVSIEKDKLLAVFGGTIMNKESVLTLSAELIKNVLQIDEALWISSSYVEKTDFISHSCTPNAGLKGQIFLVAMRDITAGEEITFDYATVVSEWVGMEPLTCNCQTSACRKRIEANDWQRKELQDKYHGYFAFYIQKKIDALEKGNEQ